MNFKRVRRSAPILSCQMHEHSFWEVIYQLDAPTTAITESGSYPVDVGEMIVMPPNTPHRTVSDTVFHDFCVTLERLDFPPIPTVLRDTDGTILGIYQVLERVQEERNELNNTILEKLTEALCLALKRASSTLPEPTAVTRLRTLLRENVENPYFDLTAAVRALGYHPDYFRRCFKRYTSLSPLHYLNGMRIERAKELLRFESSLTVGEIAARCGFRDALYFSTAFKREVGMSPLAYRNSET